MYSIFPFLYPLFAVFRESHKLLSSSKFPGSGKNSQAVKTASGYISGLHQFFPAAHTFSIARSTYHCPRSGCHIFIYSPSSSWNILYIHVLEYLNSSCWRAGAPFLHVRSSAWIVNSPGQFYGGYLIEHWDRFSVADQLSDSGNRGHVALGSL